MGFLKQLAVVGFTCGFAVSVCASTNSTISTNASQKWAWSSSIGWINCHASDTNGMIVGQYVCAGYMYSATAGWISLGNGFPTNGVHYTTNSATDYGVNHDGQGHLSGYAWSPSAGWINFGWTNATDSQAPKIDLKTGVLSGYAWGTGVGWISLSNISTCVKTVTLYSGPVSNTNGIPDAWIIQNFGSTNSFSVSADADTDGVSNADEYIAGTNPRQSNDFLRVISTSLSGTNIQISWVSSPTRNYAISYKTNLTDPVWIDSGTGTNIADVGTNTIRSMPVNTQGFFRIKAILPLQ